MVEATLTYLAAMAERPAYYLYEPPPGTPWRNTRGDRHRMPIHDARALTPAPSLEREGFMLAHLATTARETDPGAVREVYYRDVERLVGELTGADRVLAFDHNLRCAAQRERAEDGTQGPVRYAHNDYTERSGPQRVRDLLAPDEAAARLRGRVAVINVWKPIRHAAQDAPLAVCDAQSIRPDDLVPTDLHYRDRTGEVYSLRYNPAHRWYYFPNMQVDEALLLKCFDSDGAGARFTAHSAFDDPTAPPNAPPRESIEVRTLAFFGG
jgi:hypothetical protein